MHSFFNLSSPRRFVFFCCSVLFFFQFLLAGAEQYYSIPFEVETPNIKLLKNVLKDNTSIRQKDKRVFRGWIHLGDYDSNPDLDFLIEAQEFTGLQNFYLNRFQFIRIQKKYTKKYRQGIRKIRRLIKRFSKNEINRVRAFGYYKKNTERNQDKYDGILELTSIVIYRKNRDRKFIILDEEDRGIVGGIK